MNILARTGAKGEPINKASSVIDRATTEYQLKMKEAMHIEWIRPKLDKQVKHYTLSLIV